MHSPSRLLPGARLQLDNAAVLTRGQACSRSGQQPRQRRELCAPQALGIAHHGLALAKAARPEAIAIAKREAIGTSRGRVRTGLRLSSDAAPSPPNQCYPGEVEH